MDIITKITLLAETNEQVEFSEQFSDLSDLVANMPDRSSPLSTDISLDLLNFIKEFATAHSYDNRSISYTFPTVSKLVHKNISDKSYELLKPFIVEGNVSETAKKLAPLVTAADKLRFHKLYTTLNIVLISPLHIDEDKTSIKEFMDNFNLKEDEDFTPEKICQAIAENQELFELVVSRFQENIAKLEEIQGEAQK